MLTALAEVTEIPADRISIGVYDLRENRDDVKAIIEEVGCNAQSGRWHRRAKSGRFISIIYGY